MKLNQGFATAVILYMDSEIPKMPKLEFSSHPSARNEKLPSFRVLFSVCRLFQKPCFSGHAKRIKHLHLKIILWILRAVSLDLQTFVSPNQYGLLLESTEWFIPNDEIPYGFLNHFKNHQNETTDIIENHISFTFKKKHPTNPQKYFTNQTKSQHLKYQT